MGSLIINIYILNDHKDKKMGIDISTSKDLIGTLLNYKKSSQETKNNPKKKKKEEIP